MVEVYPRLRGELPLAAHPALASAGSSPLARGTLTKGDSSFTDSRFIPACAGNSTRFVSVLSVMTVHPRLRGELLS